MTLMSSQLYATDWQHLYLHAVFSRTAGTFSALVIGIETCLWESAGHEFAEQPSLGLATFKLVMRTPISANPC